VLQEVAKSNLSSFNIILIDTVLERQRAKQLTLKTPGRYEGQGADIWLPFERNKIHLKHGFELETKFAAYLDDLGMGSVHPRHHVVKLSEMFVYPDLIERKHGTVEDPSIILIEGRNIASYAIQHKATIIIGPDHSGKSTLAKVLFNDLRSDGRMPLLLNGRELRAADEGRVRDTLASVLVRQYKNKNIERYFQLKPAERAVIIDDIHEARLSRRDRNRLFLLFCRWFDVVIMIADPIITLDSLIFTEPESDFWSCRVLEIVEFGFVLRGELVRRWFMLDEPEVQDEDSIVERIIQVEDLVTRFLGRNLLPAYPLFVIAVLQELAMQVERDESAGSFGYIYEVLITRSLAKGPSAKLDLDTKYNYLTELAYRIFIDDLPYLQTDEALVWHENYCKLYKMSINFEQIQMALAKSSIIKKDDDAVSFKYKYIYYFFAARYFRDHLAESDIRNQLKKLTSRLYDEDCSNIIMFLCHLSKDPIVLESVMETSGLIFSNCAECDMDHDVEFLNKLNPSGREFTLEGSDIMANRQEYLVALDQLSFAQRQILEGDRYIQESEIYRAFSAASRTLEIIGQILRNFVGSLRGEVKRELVDKCISVGLRSLSYMLKLSEASLFANRPVFTLLLQNLKRIESEEDARATVNQRIFNLFEESVSSVFAEIAHAVGTRKLSYVLREVVELEPNISKRLVEVIAKLSRMGDFPEKEVIALARDLRKNPFSETLLRRAVWFRFYIFPESFRTRQRVCSQLSISATNPRFIDTRNKHLEK